MNVRTIRPVKGLKGEVTIPGDKSISHRSIMLGSIALGTTEITHFLEGADCLSTIDCFRRMGVEIERKPSSILVHGKGLRGLTAPASTLNVGNSGTTTRLISGILSGQNFATTLSGDASLNSRPMKRIMTPLNSMGAHITSLNDNGCAPLRIEPGELHGIHYQSPVASAQVKSAVLLAGLYAEGPTSVTEPALSRNHTELMLQGFGACVATDLHADGTATAHVEPCKELFGQQICVPGDISSAAYFIAAALLIPGSELLVRNVGTNFTRAGFLKVCKDMGADIETVSQTFEGGEGRADLLVRHSRLTGTVIEGDTIPTLIDEIPMIAVMAAFAEGTTIIRDAQELKVKESDRITVMVDNLKRMGADIEGTEDGMIIHGGKPLHGATIDSHLDHRVAMSFAVAGTICDGTVDILNGDSVKISYPEFYNDLYSLSK